MVDEFNGRAQSLGLHPQKMSAVVGNLLDDPSSSTPSSPDLDDDEYQNFDLVIVGLGFHHFPDPSDAAVRLARRVRPGGTGMLVIIDIFPQDPNHLAGSEAAPTISGHGFSRDQIRNLFVHAGCGGDSVDILAFPDPLEVVLAGKVVAMEPFMAKGIRK